MNLRIIGVWFRVNFSIIEFGQEIKLEAILLEM